MKRRVAVTALVGLGLWLSSCSGDGETVANPEPSPGTGGASGDAGTGGTSGGGAGGSSGVGANDGGGGDWTVDGGINSCASNILCGSSGTCCDVGQECVSGACMAACATGTRCGADGSICCSASDVCLADICVSPGASCDDSYDCDEGQFCEPTLDGCLPQPQGVELCEYRPPPLPFDPTVEWSWTGSPIKPEADQVINMPVVIDLDKDGIPEVIIVTSQGFVHTGPGFLRALDGKTGQEKWPASADVYLDDNQVNPRGTPAAADIDGDGAVDIVAPRRGGGVLAFNGDGSLKWRSTMADGVTPYVEAMTSVTVAIAHMDDDGHPDIVLGGVVLDYQGRLVSGQGRGYAGANNATYGAVSIIADVDGDGVQDVVTGKAAWKLDGTLIWDNGLTDGYPAIADFELDGKPELVVISKGNVRVHDAATGAMLATLLMPGQGAGGPPTIADFDADGIMEISSANGSSYNVFEYSSTPSPALSVKWQKETQDLSSNVTGSSVFDFEGDGAAEVVYGDECYFRVYSGVDGTVLYETPSSSGTIHEYPVVVDVDGDNNTEVVVVSNNLNHLGGSPACVNYSAGEQVRTGVFVYGDANDKWVRTRRVWNQHAYHITNIGSDGTLPNPELSSWVSPPGFNNYRVSTQGSGIYNAPDLQVDLEISAVPCPQGLELRARVKNNGSLGVGPGVPVSFYLGSDASGTLLGEEQTTQALLPGQSEVVTVLFVLGTAAPPFEFFVVVDGAGSVSSMIDECLEDNNNASAAGVECPTVK